MTNKKATAAAAKPAVKASTAPKPPKKLIPRTAPKVELAAPLTGETQPVVTAEVAAPQAQAPIAPATAKPAVSATAAATAAATARARPVRKPTLEDETVARHQKVLAEALEMAQGINYDQPKVMRQETGKGKKAAKPVKAKKLKLIRDSYAMPEDEYAQIAELKRRLGGMGAEAKKSELLRGGIALLAGLNDAELKAVMGRVQRIKTGRPTK